MTKKSKQVLVDAVVVIHAHENRYWLPLCNAYQIALPATVIENEVFYFDSSKGKIGLKPSNWIKQGIVTRIDAAIADYDILAEKLSNDFMLGIDAGEKEALAILISKKYKDYFFTTADKAAAKALGVLGIGCRGISVEELLKNLGNLTKKTHLPMQYNKTWLQKCIAEGLSEQNLWLKPRNGSSRWQSDARS